MYALVLMTALAGPGQPVCCAEAGWGGWWWYGAAGYAHGYGYFRPVTPDSGGLVLPPSWGPDPTPWCEGKAWFDYVMQLDGYEREDMIAVWAKATPCARKVLLAKLAVVQTEAAIYRAKVEHDRAVEKARIENRPLTDEERQFWKSYLGRLKGDKRKQALERWRAADNRGKRVFLKEIIKEMQDKEDEGDEDKDAGNAR
jgi:hypothetical protein